MATYVELNAIGTESVAGAQALREKVRVACYIAAETIISGDDTGNPWDPTNHTQRTKWVDKMLSDPEGTSRQMFSIVIAANNTASQAQILGATDSVIQTNVNESIDSLSTNLV